MTCFVIPQNAPPTPSVVELVDQCLTAILGEGADRLDAGKALSVGTLKKHVENVCAERDALRKLASRVQADVAGQELTQGE